MRRRVASRLVSLKVINEIMKKIRVKPWNRVDGPIYSLSTTAHGKGNLNICSYVTPISMKPKRYIVGVYKGTKTLENLESNPVGILNFMTDKMSNLVNILGKKSGHKIDKIKKLGERIQLTEEGLFTLNGSLATVRLKFTTRMDGGDHWAWLAEVVSHENHNDDKPLTLEYLKRKKIILA
jgi:flavin reductase (DIM6/NTAB) family NADH-FMN oxidoreductase RutF